MLRHRSQSLRWGKEISEERGGEYGEVGESFLGACDESEGEGWGEVEWTRTKRTRIRVGRFDG